MKLALRDFKNYMLYELTDGKLLKNTRITITTSKTDIK